MEVVSLGMNGIFPIAMSDFLSKIEKFLADHHMAASAFGEMALRDSGFVRGLRLGRSPRLNTVEHVQAWMKAYRKRPRSQCAPPRSRRPAAAGVVHSAAPPQAG